MPDGRRLNARIIKLTPEQEARLQGEENRVAATRVLDTGQIRPYTTAELVAALQRDYPNKPIYPNVDGVLRVLSVGGIAQGYEPVRGYLGFSTKAAVGAVATFGRESFGEDPNNLNSGARTEVKVRQTSGKETLGVRILKEKNGTYSIGKVVESDSVQDVMISGTARGTAQMLEKGKALPLRPGNIIDIYTKSNHLVSLTFVEVDD